MKVYLVRHGETEFNREKRHQFPTTPLNETGQKQAKAIAQRFTSIPIELILTSSYTRALQTAQEIEKVKSVPLIQSELLIERRMPTHFRGKLTDDPDLAPVHQSLRDHFADPNWHHSDEENFLDIIERVNKALEYIHSHNKDHIAVVTHGYILNIMIFVILFGDRKDPELFKLMRNNSELSNTGLTMCEYSKNKWKLLTLNDHAHLGELVEYDKAY